MNRVIERVNTVAAVGGLVALLGVGGYWLFNGGDEPSTGSTTGTESLENSATRSATSEDTDVRLPAVPAPAVESPTARKVEDSLNLVRTDRRRIQVGLRAYGLDPGPADGVFGAGTRAAIRDWQAARGMPSTGYLNEVEARDLIFLGGSRGKDVRSERPRGGGDHRRAATGIEAASGTGRDIPKGGGAKGGTRLDGGFGDDTLTGTDSDDTINGLHGKDTLNGAGGNDILRGSFGDDTIYGGSGDDTIYGSQGNDFIDGGQGNDVIRGGFDDDIIYGGGGDDTINGGQGNDFMDGGQGNDVIHGGFGDDAIYAGNGDDRLSGGPGKDVFHFGEAHGIDRITDFRHRDDRIDVSELPVGGFENLSLKVMRRGVQIDLTGVGGGTVLLEGLALADLDAIHFVFGPIIAGGTRMNAVEAEELIVPGGGEGEDIRAEASRPAASIPGGAL